MEIFSLESSYSAHLALMSAGFYCFYDNVPQIW